MLAADDLHGVRRRCRHATRAHLRRPRRQDGSLCPGKPRDRHRGGKNAKLEKPAIGAYSLDLTEAGKGKTLEPVRVSYSRDKKSVIIDQYTRKLPPTAVAIDGATVDFDQRFATGAKCAPFNQE